MKKLILIPFSFIFLFWLTSPVRASEGTATLSAENSSTQCYLLSILLAEGNYHQLTTCRNLIVPPQAETLYYTAWAHKQGATPDENKSRFGSFSRGEYLRLGDITSGKLNSQTREAFDRVLITAEDVAQASQPNLEKIVVQSDVVAIPFASTPGEIIAPSPTSQIAQVTLQPAKSVTPASQANQQRNVVGTALRLFLGILAVIVVVAVLISVLQRRSAS